MNIKILNITIALCISWLASQAYAAPITLAFDTLTTAPSYTEKGLTITATGDNTEVAVFTGAWGLFGSTGATAPAYSLTTGGLFDLISVDILHSDLGDPIVFEGFRNSMLHVSQTINANDFGFLSLTGFTGLDEVKIGVTGAFVDPDFDNLTYQVVPVPALAWLFAGAVLGVLRFRRA